MKQAFIVLACCSLTGLNMAGQIIVDGMHPAYDRLSNTFLVTIPPQQWGKDWKAGVALEEGVDWREVEVDGQPIDSTVTFEQVEPLKAYPLDAWVDDSLFHALIEFTCMPVIHLRGEFGYEMAPANIIFQMPGEGEQELMALAKWRGYSTNDSSKHKRNYKLNFIDKKGDKKDLRFFGLRKDNGWILDAGQTDLFRMRNHIAAKLWDDFATRPYYAEEETEVHTSSRGEMVEMFLNDQYQGIYNMCEPVDRKQMQLMKFDPVTEEIHGGLWKSEGGRTPPSGHSHHHTTTPNQDGRTSNSNIRGLTISAPRTTAPSTTPSTSS